MRLRDNVAIITGAGQGIGQATAIKFAREGAKVAVCDINEASVEGTVDLVLDDGGEAIGFVVDVTDKAASPGWSKA
jgi:3-oxoacyl-[acyl-carrier protein] reductase